MSQTGGAARAAWDRSTARRPASDAPSSRRGFVRSRSARRLRVALPVMKTRVEEKGARARFVAELRAAQRTHRAWPRRSLRAGEGASRRRSGTSSGVIVAEGEFVIVHGRFSNFGQPANWIAADILHVQDGVLVEHWDVIQDEASREQSRSGLPMFGDEFPK